MAALTLQSESDSYNRSINSDLRCRHPLGNHVSDPLFLLPAPNADSPWNPLARTGIGIRTEGLAISSSTSRSFTRKDLALAHVLGQVDDKFIACLVNPSQQRLQAKEGESKTLNATPGDGQSNSDAVLILVDQHAADERIRVERLLKEICEGFMEDAVERRNMFDASSLPRAPRGLQGGTRTGVKILLSTAEARVLRGDEPNVVRRAFKRWGFEFGDAQFNSISNGDNTLECNFTQVEVFSVPEVVADKVSASDTLKWWGWLNRTNVGASCSC